MTSAQSASYTHFVRPDGSATSFCTASEPCSLTRAVSLIGSASMRPGSVVLLQHGTDGVYSQATLTLDGSGTAEEPIRFIGENGVRLTGTRTRPPAIEWSRVPDRQFTYRMPWDDSAASRWATWPSVLRSRPGARFAWTIVCRRSRSRWGGRSPWTSRSAIRRARRSTRSRPSTARSGTTAQRRSCTCTCVMTARPAAADSLYLGPSGWGSGRHQRRLPDAREHRDRAGDRNGAEGQPLGERNGPEERHGARRAGVARRRQHAGRGSRRQPRHHAGHPSHAVLRRQSRLRPRASAGTRAGDGRALLVGRQSDATARSARSCGGRASIGRGTAPAWTDARRSSTRPFWGFPNHALEASGTGGVVRHNVVPERAGLDLSSRSSPSTISPSSTTSSSTARCSG